jgi:aldose 1-epimerase
MIQMTSYELLNRNGLRVTFLDLGGIVTSIAAPDRDGKIENVVLAFGSTSSYLEDNAYLGALIGRYANRIANARFSIDGREWTLAANNGRNHLHGGIVGFNRRKWSVALHQESGYSKAVLELVSESGDEGYPGRLDVRATYTLTDGNELAIDYQATSTEATHVNLTQHSYFNLSGSTSTDILGHELTVNASHFTPVDESLIPTGEIRTVQGTPFDFTTAKPIGAHIDDDDEQLRFGDGYDHNFVLQDARDDGVRLAATLRDPGSGRVMHIHTTEPGIQVYSGNKLPARRQGIALETQHFPDSPNQPDFPSTLLRPGEVYRSRTVYTFTTDRT